MTFIADDRNGHTVYVNAPTWTVAEQMCRRDDFTLVGEYQGQVACDFPTEGDTIQ